MQRTATHCNAATHRIAPHHFHLCFHMIQLDLDQIKRTARLTAVDPCRNTKVSRQIKVGQYVTSRHMLSRHMVSRHMVSRHMVSRNIKSCNLCHDISTPGRACLQSGKDPTGFLIFAGFSRKRTLCFMAHLWKMSRQIRHSKSFGLTAAVKAVQRIKEKSENETSHRHQRQCSNRKPARYRVTYGVAAISRLLKITGLSCKRGQ